MGGEKQSAPQVRSILASDFIRTSAPAYARGLSRARVAKLKYDVAVSLGLSDEDMATILAAAYLKRTSGRTLMYAAEARVVALSIDMDKAPSLILAAVRRYVEKVTGQISVDGTVHTFMLALSMCREIRVCPELNLSGDQIEALKTLLVSFRPFDEVTLKAHDVIQEGLAGVESSSIEDVTAIDGDEIKMRAPGQLNRSKRV